MLSTFTQARSEPDARAIPYDTYKYRARPLAKPPHQSGLSAPAVRKFHHRAEERIAKLLRRG